MPRRSEFRLMKRAVDALEVEEKDAVFWDRDLAGFGVRVHATGKESLRGAVQGAGRSEESHPGPARETHDRGGEEARRPRNRPHQAGRGPDSWAARGGTYRIRTGGALHAHTRGGGASSRPPSRPTAPCWTSASCLNWAERR